MTFIHILCNSFWAIFQLDSLRRMKTSYPSAYLQLFMYDVYLLHLERRRSREATSVLPAIDQGTLEVLKYRLRGRAKEVTPNTLHIT